MERDDLLIKYNYPSSKGVDMRLLGESLVGFDKVLKEFIDIANLNDKVSYKINRIEHGSVEIYSTIQLLSAIPFDTPIDFIDFLRIAAPELVRSASSFLSSAVDIHEAVNVYFNKNQFDSSVVSGLVVAYLLRSFKISGELDKNKLTEKDLGDLSPKQRRRLSKMVSDGQYKKAMAPMIEGDVNSIELISLADRDDILTSISEENMDDYLPEEEKILPNLNNGDRHILTGELVTLSSDRNDEMYIKINTLDKQHNKLRCTLGDDLDIEDYVDLFKKQVIIDAEVYRNTYHKKPSLIVHSISQNQQNLL